MIDRNCVIYGCGGQAVRINNFFLHTLGSDPKVKPDFSQFIECQAWRCNKCGYIQLYGGVDVIKVPSEDD